MLMTEQIKSITEGGNGHVIFWAFLIGYFGLYMLFPRNALHQFLIKWTWKLLLGGGKQKW